MTDRAHNDKSSHVPSMHLIPGRANLYFHFGSAAFEALRSAYLSKHTDDTGSMTLWSIWDIFPYFDIYVLKCLLRM